MDLRVFFMDYKYEYEDIFMHNTHIVGCREIPSRKFNMSAKVSCKVISFDVLIRFILKFVIV